MEFETSLSIQECIERLQTQHQDFAVIAWNGQTRTIVQIKKINAAQAEFSLKRIPKSWPVDWLNFGELNGNLAELNSQKTGVVARAKLGWGWIVFGQMIVNLVALRLRAFAIHAGVMNNDDLLVFILGAIMLNLLILGITYGLSNMHIQQMQRIVSDTLGQTQED